MPLQNSHVFASHIGHTGKTTLTFQMSCYFAKHHLDKSVLVMDLAEEGDLTKRFLGGVDASRDKISELCGGIFRLLDAAKSSGGMLAWLWSDTFDVKKHAIKVADHNPGIPPNLFLIASGAWPCEQKMDAAGRRKICDKIKQGLEKSPETWTLFCDTDGDRRPSDFTLIAYGLCDHAIVPLHLNKGDLDRTQTMLGMMNEHRAAGETRAQVLMIVWNFVNSNKDEAYDHNGVTLPFTPTKVNLDILDSCNKKLFELSKKECPELFVHGQASERDFLQNTTCLLRQLADNVLKPSEEMGQPFVDMIQKLNASGKKSMTFKSADGQVAYTAQDKVIYGADAAMKELESKFEAMVLCGGSGPKGSGGYCL